MASGHGDTDDSAKTRLFEAAKAPYRKLDEVTPDPASELEGMAIETTTVVTAAVLGSMLFANPVFAQAGGGGTGSPVQTVGQALCNAGAGWIVNAVFVVAAIYLLMKGSSRGVTALDHIGSVDDNIRRQGRKEATGAAGTFGGGLVVVPFIGLLIGRIVPPAFGCLGFDLSFLIISAGIV